MKTGHCILWTLDPNGTKYEKRFNFSFKRKVNYRIAYRILRMLPPKNYVLEVGGGIKGKVSRRPVLTFGEICTTLRDFRFGKVKILRITENIPTASVVNIWSRTYGKYTYTFIRFKHREDILKLYTKGVEIHSTISPLVCYIKDTYLPSYNGFIHFPIPEQYRRIEEIEL